MYFKEHNRTQNGRKQEEAVASSCIHCRLMTYTWLAAVAGV